MRHSVHVYTVVIVTPQKALLFAFFVTLMPKGPQNEPIARSMFIILGVPVGICELNSLSIDITKIKVGEDQILTFFHPVFTIRFRSLTRVTFCYFLLFLELLGSPLDGPLAPKCLQTEWGGVQRTIF